jgi:hypothetical protein
MEDREREREREKEILQVHSAVGKGDKRISTVSDFSVFINSVESFGPKLRS